MLESSNGSAYKNLVGYRLLGCCLYFETTIILTLRLVHAIRQGYIYTLSSTSTVVKFCYAQMKCLVDCESPPYISRQFFLPISKYLLIILFSVQAVESVVRDGANMQQARRSGPLPLRKLYGVHVFKVSRNWSSPTSQVFSIESTVLIRT